MSEGRLVVGLGSRIAEHGKARSLVLVVGLCAQATLGVAVGIGGTVVGIQHHHPDASTKGIGRSICQGNGYWAIVGLVVELEVVQLRRTQAYLGAEGAFVVLFRCTEESESSYDAGIKTLLHTETHEVRLQFLFLQLLKVCCQFLTQHA